MTGWERRLVEQWRHYTGYCRTYKATSVWVMWTCLWKNPRVSFPIYHWIERNASRKVRARRQNHRGELSYDGDPNVHSKSYNSDQIEVLYRQHGAALLLFALSISGDRGRAQDVLHQVFLKLIENGEFHPSQGYKRLTSFACVRNAVLNHYKRENRSAPLDDTALWFSPPRGDYTAERNLRQALSELPQNQREVIVLHIWGESRFQKLAIYCA